MTTNSNNTTDDTLQPTDFSRLSTSLADTAERAAGGVVGVSGPRRISGTVIGAEQILTIAHALHADEVKVHTNDGRELSASVLGRDPQSDLALLSVPGLNGSVPASAATPRVGELLLALGRPGSVQAGGVQASLGMAGLPAPASGWLATGAAPFRGVSGGPLLNAHGQLLGILNAGAVRGQLLAIPVAEAMRVAGVLADKGHMPQGYLGVGTQPLHLPAQGAADGRGPEAEAQSGPRGRGGWNRGDWNRGGEGRGGWNRGGWGRGNGGRLGLTVVRVEDGSPAAAAGLTLGDILLKLNGEALHHPGALHQDVRRRAGETVTLSVLRGGQEQTVSVTLGER